jgi:hypothetical protein
MKTAATIFLLCAVTAGADWLWITEPFTNAASPHVKIVVDVKDKADAETQLKDIIRDYLSGVQYFVTYCDSVAAVRTNLTFASALNAVDMKKRVEITAVETNKLIPAITYVVPVRDDADAKILAVEGSVTGKTWTVKKTISAEALE